MFISTIIPTIGRTTLARAVYSVLEQQFMQEECEVIVVNDSGRDLPVEDWQTLPQIRIISTNRHNRSVARNTGAAVATGRYFHFLDDDDWMLPGAFEAFWKETENNSVAWIHGAFRMVDNDGTTVTELYPDETGNCSIQMLAWEWLPLQASVIRADAFFAVDGFASLPSLGGGFEDVHLSRQISLYNDMARIAKVVTAIRIGDVSSTTNYGTMFYQNRISREKTMSARNAFRRLIDSARSNPSRSNYWFGKVIYYYMASAKWNLQEKQLLTAASRGIYTFAGFLLARSRLLSSELWRGVIRPHYPRMGKAIQDAGADHLYANTRRAIDLSATKSKR
jgi:glycosyltransferase involved in cell wall biosynthesis